MNYTLQRSHRRTIALCITPQGLLEVRAPLHVPQKQIDAFVEQKKDWVQAHLRVVHENLQKKTEFALGKTLLLLGRECPVQRTQASLACFQDGCFLLPYGTLQEVKPALIALYRKLAQAFLQERCAYYSKKMNVAPTSMRISCAQKRWGSCSGKNGLNFAWRLILAPPEAVDYVVVHELAHILQHNHSPAFWHEVCCVLPNYKEQEKLLKPLQKRLAGENWE